MNRDWRILSQDWTGQERVLCGSWLLLLASTFDTFDTKWGFCMLGLNLLRHRRRVAHRLPLHPAVCASRYCKYTSY